MTKRNEHIIKWLGGKSSLVNEISEVIGKTPFQRYVELFAGSMVIPLILGITDRRFDNMIINDINAVLIELYKEIQTDPTELIRCLEELNTEEYNTREEYEKLRDKFNQIKFAPYTSECGAIFIYLNKRCFNGMYRENQKGGFNVPYRAYKSGIFNVDIIQKLHLYFKAKNVQFYHVDYKQLLERLNEGDLVYLDPPYYPCSTNCFTSYHSSGFGVKEQNELAAFINELNRRGIKFILSNTPCDEIEELYKNYTIIKLNITRKMRSAAVGKTDEESDENNECIITNIK